MKNFILFQAYQKINRLRFYHDAIGSRYILIGFVLLTTLLSYCTPTTENHTKNDNVLSPRFKKIDSIYLAGDLSEANQLLDSARHTFNDNESLSYYYYYKGQINYKDTLLLNKYADSALYLFREKELQKKYPNAFIKALLLKCDVYLYFKQYDEALEYYFKIKSLINKDENPLNYVDYISKIAQLYYTQHRYLQAAHYNLQALDVLKGIKNADPQALFYLTQGALNNAGFSYEKAGVLDSAALLYEKGLAYLDKEQTNGKINVSMINSSRIVFLDNLGGLMAQRGNYSEAQQLLEQSISIDNYSKEKSKSTAFLKLADVYIHLNKLNAADSLLKVTEKLVYDNNFDKNDVKARLKKAWSNFYLAKNNYKEAYHYLSSYFSSLDSARQSVNDLSKVDLSLRFESMQNKEDLRSLEKTNEYKTMYLIAALVFLMMLTFIVALALINTKQAKKAEKTTIKHSKQLEKAMRNLEKINKDYAKMMKVMAHDLKNPIGGMVGIANLLLEEKKFSEEDSEMLQLIATSGENSIEMINQLLNSRLAIENEVINKEKIDIQHLLRQCTELLQYKADEKQQKLIFISGGPVHLLISREKIWRVFNNLIVNAIKFSPLNTVIKVVLERLDKSILIAVVDQGIGVADKDKEKIFEMFTTAKRPGTSGEQPFGIGLSISKQIIESHNGKIWLEDNPTGGTIFYVELPL